jgi:hypothetical protein
LIFKDDDTEELAKDYASRKLQANKMLPHK